MNSLPILRLQFFTIRTRDLKAARKFYVEQLGFNVISEKEGEYIQSRLQVFPYASMLTWPAAPRSQIRSELRSATSRKRFVTCKSAAYRSPQEPPAPNIGLP